MGKRGPTPKIAALPSGHWGCDPPIDQAEAEVILAALIPDDTWEAIREAFGTFARRRALIDAPRANRNRNDPASYEVMRAKAIKLLKKGEPIMGLGLDRSALIEIASAFAGNAELAELSKRAGAKQYNADPDAFHTRFDWRILQRRDPESRARALEILEAARPRPYQPVSLADAKAELAHRIGVTLDAAGLPTEISTGYELGENAAEYDLTPFEQLISALEIHEAERPSAMSAWMREVFID
jgi:hypothetical protein